MSFASDTKNELARIEPEKKCCQLAEIAGFLRAAGGVKLLGGGKFQVVVTTDNPAVARHYKKLLKSYYGADPELIIGAPAALKKGHTYSLEISPDMGSEAILRETGILMIREGHNYLADGIYDEIIRTKCCRKSYLRGIFLASGTVSSPEKSYHLEFVCNTEKLARDLKRLIGTFEDLEGKVVSRREKFIVYMKNSQYISDTLAIMGAHSQVLSLEDVKITKEMRGSATRLANCDNANTDRTLDASMKQVRAIRRIQETLGLEALPEKLKELAVLRVNNPEASLTQLGEMMSPPLKKSGVNNRMKRIMDFAGKI